MTGIAVSADRLTRDFGRLRALDEPDLIVPEGVIFGYLGPNGSGRTTTINLLLGVNGSEGRCRRCWRLACRTTPSSSAS